MHGTVTVVIAVVYGPVETMLVGVKVGTEDNPVSVVGDSLPAPVAELRDCSEGEYDEDGTPGPVPDV